MINILVVEDDPNTRKLMEVVLRDERYTPLLA
jgi:DNA-binding response OmpR family regulator